RLELEVTETAVMDQPDKAAEQLSPLRELGVTVAIDDFGTGHSSLLYLKRLPIDKLKIDKGFVQDLPEDPNGSAIARAIIAMGRALQLTVVAEGIETEAQQEFLLAEGCNQGQGFLWGSPAGAREVLAG
ncbi:MAG TPA: EAL domain-containing protein, partial [Gammaproteobacteria bacterium]|nr:EAL domain-containing protein [Gammaproteobacteria bacterium]